MEKKTIKPPRFTTTSRNDRVAQMTKQEEIIAKKKRELVEKQRTAELAKAIAAATNEGNKSTDTTETSTSATPRNSFNNDGSFLENFKKITQAANATTALNTKGSDEALGTQLDDSRHPTSGSCEDSGSHEREEKFERRQRKESPYRSEYAMMQSQAVAQERREMAQSQSFSLQIPPPPPPTCSSFPPITAPVSVSNAKSPPPFFNPNIPPPGVLLSTPPPTPVAPPAFPPPLLHTIPPPAPLVLNEIPAPKALDLNAIPKPELNLDVIKVPEFVAAPPPPPPPPLPQFLTVFSDNEIIPTTIDTLVVMVAENGDAYEDKIRSRKNDVHSSLWFLFDTQSEAYQNYRRKVVEVRSGRMKEVAFKESDKYDPEEVCNDYEDEEALKERERAEEAEEYLEYHRRFTEMFKHQDDEEDAHDSDSEYRREVKERSFNNMKRRSAVNYDDTDSTESEQSGQSGGFMDSRDFQSMDRAAELKGESSASSSSRRRKRSRWGEKVEESKVPSPPESQSKPSLSTVSRSNPALLQYALQNFGTTNLSEEDWKKAEDHYKINLLYQDMLKKRQEIDRLAKKGQFKYEYDSDEDITGGTWEHKLRMAEMDATKAWAEALTKQSEGRHHIGDFLPPEELRKFMEKYNAKKNNREPDMSDYKEYKLKEDNIGFQMLQKLGWKEGTGLGAEGRTGIVDPINKASQREMNQGLGANSNATPPEEENEYEAYRRRMMLAYRFRPNPLNNPRRAYY
ncbi:SURP and G-patch domain-containing protein 1 [Phlebotomus argentipes]|uniref:SURP and G-patch domain-containing protein 1 n=1 Tax=Phlebotomus argentipes TaxID=94469 RepID=UPI0028932EFB|nr:SURP and G-patch domain-containing protein 1 [Phlebotomus argentipes]